MATFSEVTEARRLLVGVLGDLDEEQWRQQSCCEQWTVQDVVAHLLAGPAEGMKGLLGPLVRARMDLAAASVELASRLTTMGPEALVAGLNEHVESRFAPPGLGPAAPLADTVIHTLDICRPLGIEPNIPTEWSAMALDAALSRRFASVNQGGRSRAVSYRATDIDRSWGEGPEIVGQVADLAHGAWGRTVEPERLQGAGAARLTGVGALQS